MAHASFSHQAPRPSPFQRRKRYSLRFRIPYYTQWGHSLVVLGSENSLGAWDLRCAVPMTPHHQQQDLFWSAVVVVPGNFQTEYRYCVVDEKLNVVRRESDSARFLNLPEDLPDGASVVVNDLWQDASSPESLLSRSAFQKAVFQLNAASDHDGILLQKDDVACVKSCTLDSHDSVLVQFNISCPRLRNGQEVHLTGGAAALGMWVLGKALRLSAQEGSHWRGECVLKTDEFPLRYKYVLKNQAKLMPEVGSDRELCLDRANKKQALMMVISDGYFKENPWRGAGLAIPVFSIRSKDDLGVGEFLDLKLLVDLAVELGLHLIQLLPVNDTSVNGMWWDSYPYSSLSVFALHPLYLNLQALSKKLPHSIKEEIKSVQKKLDLKQVDYDATTSVKLSIAKKVYHSEKDEVLGSAAFEKFFNENQEWLKPYAAFCFLRDLFGTSDHSQWGLFSNFSSDKVEKLVCPTTEHFGAIGFNYYLQFHLHLQLLEAAEYARSNGVVLKGDLPIGVGRHSVDTWVHPTLFRMNTSTGAPPDYFDKNGQNWGFPTYNWEEMSKDNYGWWRARLTQMAKYFTAYRIDHVLGFFRIWELPEHAATGLMGKFRPSIPLSQEELEHEGIWDFNKLSRPYIRCHILQDIFGPRWTDVASRFFDEYEPLCYEFKEEYNTEKKIVKRLESVDGSVKGVDRLREKLIELTQEVVLLRDPEDPKKFYPRFNIEQTASFNELDDGSKHTLRRLYHDYYFQRQEGLWRENAMKTLPVLLNSSDMLACGEDLGLIPACVQPVLQELGLLGLRIQRMPSALGLEFAIPADYEYTTVCAPSCHDTSTIRAWWEEDEGRRCRFFKDALHFDDVPPAACDPTVVYTILQQHLEAPSMWAIFPFQDILALKSVYAQRPASEEIINDPTNPRHYWRYRLHVSLEELLSDSELISLVRDMVVTSGRSTPNSKKASVAPILSPTSNGNGYSLDQIWMPGTTGKNNSGQHLKQNQRQENGQTRTWFVHGTLENGNE